MRPLHRARPDRGQPDREELAVVNERLLGPGAREVVLGEPQVVEPHRLGEYSLVELLMDGREVLRRRRRQRERHPPELHGPTLYRTPAGLAGAGTSRSGRYIPAGLS